MARKPGIDDVALLAEVSVSTVDRVLNARGGVAPDKEARVLSAARRLKLDRLLSRRYTRALRIAVLIQPPANPFHAALKTGFVVAARAYADLNMQFLVHYLDPNDPVRTAAAIDAHARRHDGLILTSADHPRIAEATRRAAAALPLITLATDIPATGRQAYVGPDDRQAGRVAGDLMGRFLGPPGGDVIMIAGLLAMVGHREREAGFRAVLAEHHPACRFAGVLESREDIDGAGHLVLDAMRANPAIRGLYHASAGARPVVEALRALGGPARIIFITHELTEDRRVLLRERAIDAVIDQDPEAEVRVAVETMARLLGRLDGVPDSTVTPIRIYTPENVRL
jgi:LacI family transcriptional regulator